MVTRFTIWKNIILALGADGEPLLPTLRDIRFEAGNRDRADEMIAAIGKAVAEKKAQKKS
jgi:hypothetical protein